LETTAVQPEYEQPPLPFQDEVLVVLYKDELPLTEAGKPRWLNATRRRLNWRVNAKAVFLGFKVHRTHETRVRRGDRLHISVRAEAVRA
jgi:hypothetical protein